MNQGELINTLNEIEKERKQERFRFYENLTPYQYLFRIMVFNNALGVFSLVYADSNYIHIEDSLKYSKLEYYSKKFAAEKLLPFTKNPENFPETYKNIAIAFCAKLDETISGLLETSDNNNSFSEELKDCLDIYEKLR